ncbi:hypothetical protein PsYK624_036440 [Phanerochaete sordida]|uniref:PB1 domain-containing protein n=1 Tax=Phanerochaete sordida TaxID=48140 RepID=A0A9P3G3F9_9APHY|nr:hypothetical protein PsYK624_036440 [Phanerochaete sordida]
MQAGTLFKFTKPPDGLTRRVMFYNQPAWDELADKIQSLYGVPKDKVGVSYLDVDGDEVTLSSQEELQDYYKFNLPAVRGFGQSGEALKAIRFTVRDLGIARDADPDKPLPRTPSAGSALNDNRNTFGVANPFTSIFDAGDDWEPINAFTAGPAPSMFIPIIPEESPAPHAFLEPVPSDAASTVKDHDSDTASTVTETDTGTLHRVDKGKRKATVEDVSDDDDEVASTVSLVASNSPEKPAIHVASHVGTEDTFGARQPADPEPEPEATPKPLEKEVIPDVDDPPLPELEDIQAAPHPNASLANDIARLLNTFSSVLSSHPELSEGVRNVVRNATNGAYWTAHRDAVARAAEEVRRNAEQSVQDARRVAEDAHRAAEEAAGRRVAEALGSIVRTINQYTGQPTAAPEVNTTSEGPITSTPVAARNPEEAPRRRPVPPRRPTYRHSWFGPGASDPLDPHFEPFFSAEGDMHRPSRGMFFPPPPHGPYNAPPGPPPPPLPQFLPTPLPPPHSRPPFQMPPPPPPRHPMPGAWPPPAFMAGMRGGWGNWGASDTSATRVPEHGGSSAAYAPPPPPPPAQTEPELSAKDALQAAKEKYKAEKERYRRERELRRLTKKRMMNTSSETESQPLLNKDAPPREEPEPDYTEVRGPKEPPAASSTTHTEEPETQIVSNARGGFPQLEMISLSPRRHHTMHATGRHGHGGRHAYGRPNIMYPPPPPPPPIAPVSVPQVPIPPPPPSHPLFAAGNPFAARPANGKLSQSVTHRLAEMGFTAAGYPNLPSKVNAQVARFESTRQDAAGSDVSRDAEDSVVAEIVEELLSAPTPGPSTAGSGNLRRSNTTVPGSWN